MKPKFISMPTPITIRWECPKCGSRFTKPKGIIGTEKCSCGATLTYG